MLSERRKSFIALRIESMETIEFKKQQYDLAIRIINSRQTFMNLVFTLYYNFCKYLLSYAHLKTIYLKKYSTAFIIMSSDDFIVKESTQIKLFDCGMELHGLWIPYEYIIKYHRYNEYIFMEIFASIDDNSQIKLENKILKINLKFLSCYIAQNVASDITSNMYYHIKYNKFDDTVIEYFESQK